MCPDHESGHAQRASLPPLQAPPVSTPEPAPSPSRLDAGTVLGLQRTAGNAAVASLLRTPEVCEVGDVALQPVSVSPPRAQLLGDYDDAQVSEELYGRPDVPFTRFGPDEVEVHYSSLTAKWKPAFGEHASAFERRRVEGDVESDW